MDFDNSAQVDALAKLSPEPPKAPERSAWTVVPRGIASGAGKIGAAIVEGVAAISPSDEELRRNPGRTAFSAEDLGLTARSARDYERTLRPDPITAGTAEQVVYGLTSGLTEVAAGAVIAGPAGAAAALGGGEGATVTDDLQRQGVDNRTARMAGAVTGVVNAASVALPLAGPTLKATAGLYVAGGPGGFMAQQAATSAILERAGYAKIAEQFDPLDPVGLTLSALIPLPFAAYGARRVMKAGKSGADATAKPEVAPVPEAPTVPREAVDAAMVHNLTLQRQAQDAVPARDAIHAMQAADPTSFAARLDAAITERGISVAQGERSQAGGIAGERTITIANLPEADFMAKHGAPVEDVKAHEFAHTYWAGATALPNFKDPANRALRAELQQVSQEFRPAVWESHKAHAQSHGELLADGMAFWLKNPERRAEFPAVDKMMRGYDAGDLIRNFPDVRASDPRPAPPPAPKPDPAPAPLSETIAKAQEELAAFKASGKTLDEFVAGKELPPAVNNLLIGLAETMKNPARAKALLDMVGKADAKADPANATADAVEAVRALTDDQLTNTATDPKPAAPDALMQSVSERVAAVELTNPDMPIGVDDSGNPITVRDELARIRREAMEGTDTELGGADADLVNVAANCALTNGG